MRLSRWMATVGVMSLLAAPAFAQVESGTIRVKVRIPGTMEPISDVRLSLTDRLPDNEEDLLAYLKQLATARVGAGNLSIRVGNSEVYSGPANCVPRTTAPAIPAGSATTDVEGTAVFRNLSAGVYTIRVGRDGYVVPLVDGSGTAVASTTASSSVIVDPGKVPAEVSFFLNPAATVSGRVRNTRGLSVGNLCVFLEMPTQLNGRTVFLTGPGALTDANGEYRLRSVSPGAYFVRVERTNSAYYPENVSRATLLTIQPGRDMVGIDIDLP